MGNRYSLQDSTLDRELLSGGREIMQLMWHMDDPDRAGAPVAIFDRWEHHDLSGTAPAVTLFDAATVAADMATLISELERLDPAESRGGLLVSQWVNWFRSVREHALAHPRHQFRSLYFE